MWLAGPARPTGGPNLADEAHGGLPGRALRRGGREASPVELRDGAELPGRLELFPDLWITGAYLFN